MLIRNMVALSCVFLGSVNSERTKRKSRHKSRNRNRGSLILLNIECSF